MSASDIVSSMGNQGVGDDRRSMNRRAMLRSTANVGMGALLASTVGGLFGRSANAAEVTAIGSGEAPGKPGDGEHLLFTQSSGSEPVSSATIGSIEATDGTPPGTPPNDGKFHLWFNLGDGG